MLITHKFSLDLTRPESPRQIQVKQGDAMTHSLEILLFSDGEPWLFPAGVTPLVRWYGCDVGSGQSACGIFDTLPNGSTAWNCSQNQLDLVLPPQMFALPGVVRADVALVQGEKVLGTANFEFYVNQAPVNGTEPQFRDYYKLTTLEEINKAIASLQNQQQAFDQSLAYVERDIQEINEFLRDL